MDITEVRRVILILHPSCTPDQIKLLFDRFRWPRAAQELSAITTWQPLPQMTISLMEHEETSSLYLQATGPVAHANNVLTELFNLELVPGVHTAQIAYDACNAALQADPRIKRGSIGRLALQFPYYTDNSYHIFLVFLHDGDPWIRRLTLEHIRKLAWREFLPALLYIERVEPIADIADIARDVRTSIERTRVG